MTVILWHYYATFNYTDSLESCNGLRIQPPPRVKSSPLFKSLHMQQKVAR